jgi:hypothetical protein
MKTRTEKQAECVGGVLLGGEGEGTRLRRQYMADGLHIPT